MMGSNLCPKCGSDNFRTVASHVDKDSNRRRKKVCGTCGCSWHTLEIMLDEVVQVRKARKLSEELRKILVDWEAKL